MRRLTARSAVALAASGLWLALPAQAQEQNGSYDASAYEYGDYYGDYEGYSDSGATDQATRKTASANSRANAPAAPTRSGTQDSVAPPGKVRLFHRVLAQLLGEFGGDVRMGQIKGLKNVAVRKVRVSQAIPRTYEDYIKTMISERIRKNSQVKLISCVPCNTRTSSLVDGKLKITSPATNLAKLESAAATLGIENFIDAVLIYHTTHMVLAVNVFNIETKELMWSKSYNSETLKARYQELAVDYSQVAEPEAGEEYDPEYRFLFGAGGAAIPNVGGTERDSSMLNVQMRATERFNNRRTEFGLMLSLLRTTASLIKEYPSEGDNQDGGTDTDTDESSSPTEPEPFEQAIGIYGIYAHNFVGEVESYNEVRHGAHLGAGGLLATGYIAPALRLGWDIYFGRRFTTSFGINYIGASSILVEGETLETKGGMGADVVLSLNY